MADFLKIHALENVWCEPAQDRHWIVQAIRLTPIGGTFLSVTVGWEQVALPVIPGANRVTYHVYQIGQISPQQINVIDRKGVWIPASEICETNNVMFHAYFDNGINVPIGACFFMVTRDKNVLVAIRSVVGFGGVPGTTPMDDPGMSLFVRFYSNAYFDSPRWMSLLSRPSKGIRVLSRRVLSINDFNEFKAQSILIANEYGSLGKGTNWIDGFIQTSETGWTSAYVGKWFEYVWDASIRKQIIFNINDLQSFQSDLDEGSSKLLLLTDTTYDTIEYQDDTDLYFVNTDAGNYKGIYVHRNFDNCLRQVTHNAYALKAAYLDTYAGIHDFLASVPDDQLVLNVREAGFKRGLIHQNNRIEELYRMDYATIVNAMVGVNATVNVWKAETLEVSAYTEIMRSTVAEITDVMIEDAYGYNALTQITSYPYQTPRTSPGGNKLVDMPDAMQIPHPVSTKAERCIFCYDNNGKLIKWFNNAGNYETVAIPQPTVGITVAEVLNNKFDDTDGTYYPVYHSGTNTFTNVVVAMKDLAFNGFRCYVCPIVTGVPNEVWYDVTDNLNNYYTYDDSGPVPTLTWNAAALALAFLYPCVKINRRVLFYKVPLNVNAYPGMIDFTINARMTFNGVTGVRPQQLDFACVDVFMGVGGVLTPLMEDIDYKKIGPQIIIYRVPPSTPPEGLEVYVRCYGFCDADTMSHYGPRDSGFVKGGLLSVDGTVDIRNDRNIRVILGGSLKLSSAVKFAENATGPLSQNGLPFTVTDVVVPVEHFTSKDTVAYRKQSLDIDEVVQDYLNVHLEEVTVDYPTIVPDPWALYSPFASALIHALKTGFLGAGELDTPYDNLDIEGWVSQYAYLLDFDPCVIGSDEDYTHIRPHQYVASMSLTASQYEFMVRINTQYLNSKLNYSQYITIEEP